MPSYIESVKQRFLLATVIILLIAGSIVSFHEYQLIVSEEKNNITLQHENIHRSYSFILKQLENDLLLYSNMILNSKELRKAIAKKERSKVHTLTQESYEFLKNNNPFLKIMTFRLHDGTTLLRLHKPEMFGDELHPSREIIIQTNQTHTPHTGFEIGKLEMVYRSVIPIFYEKRYVGSLELGIDTDYIIQSLKRVGYLQYGLLVKHLESSALLTKSVLYKIDDFYLVKSDPLFTQAFDKIDLNTKKTEAVCCDRMYIISSDLDVFNFKGEPVAKILIGFDIHDITQRTDAILKRSILFILFIILILTLIINAGFKFFTRQLISTQTELENLNKTLEQRVNEEVEKNRQQEKHLLHQSRLAQMGEVLSMIAHQWRQPLSSINAIITSIKLKYALKDFDLKKRSDQEALMTYTQEQLDKVENSVINLSEIIDDFKDFYKPTHNKVTVGIDKLVKRALTLVEASFKSNRINYEIQCDDNSKVDVHFNEVTQVILNLIQNALEEMVEHQTTNPTVTLKTFSDEHNAYIEVCDNGDGIDKELTEKIFDPYFSTKESKNGSGLGLYMSKMIIEEHHHGKFYLKTDTEQTCFVISLIKSFKAD